MPIQPPPLDSNGNVIPHDHNEILNDDFVIRRISEQQITVDIGTGKKRISSLAFKASSGNNGSMSVDIEKLIIEDGIDPKKHVTTPRWMGSIRIQVSPIRDASCTVGYDPLPENPPEPANPYHGGVWGNFNRTVQKAIRQASSWFVEIPEVDIKE